MSVAEKMTAIADAIREKTGDTAKLSLDGMAETLRKLPGPIVATASGSPISLTDATDLKLRGLKLFGKTTQNGTPTPDAPVPLVSAGDGGAISITISGENAQTQTLPVSTPNGLPGIPVTSGGNYTDETGQQWICDEVDFARGVYVQRVQAYTFIGTELVTAPYWDSTGFAYSIGNYGLPIPKTDEGFTPVLCNYLSGNDARSTSGRLYFRNIGSLLSQGEAIAYLKTLYDSGNPFNCQYVIETPIETHLSAEELAAYAALHTNYPNTTILNDGGAGMEVSYVADTKLYIDNKINAMAAAIVNA